MGGRGSSLHVAYVGIAGNLRQRIDQHLVRRDSSVTTHTTAASINPDHVTEVRWWLSTVFDDSAALAAAETIAVEVLNPVLRSRGRLPAGARSRLKDRQFVAAAKAVFRHEATGRFAVQSLLTALDRLDELERRVERLEARR